jgi:membrane protein required for colicin V production
MLNSPWSEWFPAVKWIDLSLLFILLLFGIRGYFKGLFREVFSLAGLALGFIAAVRYDASLAAWLGDRWSASPLLLKGAAFVGLFFVVYFLLNLTGWLLHRSARILFLHTLNRIAGVAIGVAKGAVVLAMIVFLVSSASWVSDSTREKFAGTYLVSPLSRLGEGILRAGRERLFPRSREEA